MHLRKQRQSQFSLPSPSPLPLPMPSSTSSSSLRTSASSRFISIILTLSVLLNIYLLFRISPPEGPPSPLSRFISYKTTSRQHIVFAIASSSGSWSRRGDYVRLWYNPGSTRAFAFLDRAVPDSSSNFSSGNHTPPVIISAGISKFPYTFPRGLRSAIRVARVVKEIVERNLTDVRWFVFGDDDTIFFVDNLVKTLSKYDHERWYYIGSCSESFEQNAKHSFHMAFGGGGFAISNSLARVLARVLDSCLMRYGHLYGSDARIFSCLAELGVELSHEPGFHQVDMRGNLFGMLAAHSLSPIVSLHHLEAVEPIFPRMNRTQALQHLFAAVNVDPIRTLQQTVCYDRPNSLTISISWGYAIEVFEGNELLPDLLSLPTTFMPWKRGSNVENHFLFNMRDYPRDPCKRPMIFYRSNVTSSEGGIWSKYTRDLVGKCLQSSVRSNLRVISVFSTKLELHVEELKAPRRQCCDVMPSSNQSITVNIRYCRTDELISMHI